MLGARRHEAPYAPLDGIESSFSRNPQYRRSAPLRSLARLSKLSKPCNPLIQVREQPQHQHHKAMSRGTRAFNPNTLTGMTATQCVGSRRTVATFVDTNSPNLWDITQILASIALDGLHAALVWRHRNDGSTGASRIAADIRRQCPFVNSLLLCIYTCSETHVSCLATAFRFYRTTSRVCRQASLSLVSLI